MREDASTKATARDWVARGPLALRLHMAAAGGGEMKSMKSDLTVATAALAVAWGAAMAWNAWRPTEKDAGRSAEARTENAEGTRREESKLQGGEGSLGAVAPDDASIKEDELERATRQAAAAEAELDQSGLMARVRAAKATEEEAERAARLMATIGRLRERELELRIRRLNAKLDAREATR